MSAQGKYSRLFLFVKDVGDLFYLLSESNNFQAQAFNEHRGLVFKHNTIEAMSVIFVARNNIFGLDVFIKHSLEILIGEGFELTLNHNFLKLVPQRGLEPLRPQF